jgi:hypothetical protein
MDGGFWEFVFGFVKLSKGLLVGSEVWAEMTLVVVFASLVAGNENNIGKNV